MQTTYKNRFYIRHNPYSRPEITAYGKPEEYKGYLIYEYSIDQFHIVADGVCVGMYAGPNGAKRRIEELSNRE